MSLTRSAVRDLYTRKADDYTAFVRAFHSRHGLRAVLSQSNLARAGIRILDAGCGAGMATFALLDVFRSRHIEYHSIDAFDLTPAMLDRFQSELNTRTIPRVQVRQADVLTLESLPASWENYDLILCTSMLEYLARPELPLALGTLRARLAPGGHLFTVITQKTLETKVFIEWWWKAERYTKSELLGDFEAAGFSGVVFGRFPWYYFWLNRANYVLIARK